MLFKILAVLLPGASRERLSAASTLGASYLRAHRLCGVQVFTAVSIMQAMGAGGGRPAQEVAGRASAKAPDYELVKPHVGVGSLKKRTYCIKSFTMEKCRRCSKVTHKAWQCA